LQHVPPKRLHPSRKTYDITPERYITTFLDDEKIQLKARKEEGIEEDGRKN
jgi:hypothetical protein